MEEDTNGNIILQGKIKIKRLFSPPEMNKIEPIIIKES